MQICLNGDSSLGRNNGNGVARRWSRLGRRCICSRFIFVSSYWLVAIGRDSQLQTGAGRWVRGTLTLDWRARERAKTLLLLGRSLLCREVAQLQDLDICTVGQTWQHWCQEGMACLSGKPRKLDKAAAQRLVQWARKQPLSAPDLLQRHTEAKGEPVHIDTLVRYLKEGGLVWKRTRHNLKKRDDTAFEL
jgi:transposase